jgi:hypothetical protein
MWRSYGGRSSRTCCVFSSVWGAGSTGSCLVLCVSRARLDLIKLVALVSKPNRAMLCTGSGCAEGVGRGLWARVLCMGNPKIRVLPSWSSSVICGLWLRSVQGASLEVLEFSTHIGLTRIQHTSTLRWFWLTQHTLWFVKTLESTGLSTQFISIGSSEDWHQLARSIVVCMVRVTCTPRLALQCVPPGNATTHFLWSDTAETP